MDIEFKNRFSRKMQILFYLLLKNYTFIFLNYAYNLIYKFLQHIHSIYIFFIHYNKYYYCTLDFNFPLNLYFEHIYIYCGAEGFGKPGPFHIKPKAHAEKEETSEDE